MSKLALKAQESQRLAAQPQANVWVSASAGSGKTKVLCDRILNLLLEGVPPQRILCLTFTNAAAAEMANRLQDRVGEWAICSDQKLADDLRALRENNVTEDHMMRARILFDLVLESPGGLKIQTLHSFCQSLLKRFPLESNLPPHFEVIDEREAWELVKTAQHQLFEHPPSSSFEEALAFLLDEITETTFQGLIIDILSERSAWERFFHTHKSLPEIQNALRDHLQVDEVAANLDTFWESTQESPLLAVTKELGQGSVTEVDRAELLLKSYQARDFDLYASAFLTQKGDLRAKLYTTAFAKHNPNLAELLDREAQRVIKFIETRKVYKTYERSSALTTFAHGFLKAYQALKKSRCALDYDDLILETLKLLQTPGTAPWVLYKFDGGVDHILIDEAQDTSPTQWEVIKALTEEFFSGNDPKTLFVVGDEKQSIYSFQGADPETFSAMKSFFKARAFERERLWEKVSLGISFRSAPEILEAVDAVFKDINILNQGLEEEIRHEAFRAHLPGHVEVWPLCPRMERQELAPWSIIESEGETLSPRARLAQKWARTIRQWLSEQRWLTGQNRPIHPGDILILVRKRGEFVEDIIHFLKEEGVPVAGHDRLRLQDHIVTQDLISLFEVILLPQNDLALASLLKSPFFGLDDDALFDFAWDRGSQSLWDRLSESLKNELLEISQEAKLRTPFSFLMWLMSAKKSQEKFTQRLGAECHDAFEEILSLALQFEKDHIPSLQGFLDWLSQGNLMVKRDLEEQNEVRVMTVHGSKGLQAPIVILPDTTQVPADYPSFAFEAESGLPLWLPAQTEACPRTAALKFNIKEAQIQEYRRLLYVAMTRAQDELYVSGWENARDVSDDSWYQMIVQGLGPISELQTFKGDEIWSGDSLILSSVSTQKVANNIEPEEAISELPSWLFERVKVDQKDRVLRPSSFEKTQKSYFSKATLRGIQIHKLLETLPNSLSEGDDELTQLARHIIKSYPDLFSRNSRGEVPVFGEVNDLKISGQIDRLIVHDHKIQIVDYKTTKRPPQNGEIPANYIQQLAAYALLMREIYPTHHIECGILWTEIPRLDWIREDIMKAAIDSVSSLKDEVFSKKVSTK